MLRDITIGQYYMTESWIHKLDPRTKIIATFLYIMSMFIFDSIAGYIVAAIFLAGIIWISNVPPKYIVRGLKTVIALLAFTVIFQLLFTTGGEKVVDLKYIRIYSYGIYSAVFIVVRIIFLIIGSSMMTYTTTPNQLTDGFEYILRPLKIFKIQAHDIAMMMSIALRYIPILLEEADKIMKAQMARGADFENGSLIKRAKNMIPLLVPLFVSAFRRASELALAMEARCYRGGEGRTKMKPLRYSKVDGIAYVIVTVYYLINIVIACVL